MELQAARDMLFVCRYLGIKTAGIWSGGATPHMRKHHLAEGIKEMEYRFGRVTPKIVNDFEKAYRSGKLEFVLQQIINHPKMSMIGIATSGIIFR